MIPSTSQIHIIHSKQTIMKKIYSAPTLTTITYDLEEGVLSASIGIHQSGGKINDETMILSVGGWDSSNWAPAEPEENEKEKK